MSLSAEQYLSLSTLAYSNLGDVNSSSQYTIGYLIANKKIKDYYKDGSVALELRPLSSLSNWILINAHASPSGMSAIAVQNPETKEIVFAYRGTNGILGNLEDWLMNLKIAVGANLTIDNGKNQFIDALNFYYDTVQKAGGASNITKRSFTGHSLGGGIAQYIESSFDKKENCYA